MPCGKRVLVKNWDKHRVIPVITPSRYEQNEASVKQHWKKVIRDLELSYKDDQFWETQCDTVRELVGPTLFERLAKIFNLPLEATQYEPQSEVSSVEESQLFYKTRSSQQLQETREEFSMSDYEAYAEEEEVEEEESEQWSVSSVAESVTQKKSSRLKSVGVVKSMTISKSTTKGISKSFVMSKPIIKSFSVKTKSARSILSASTDESAQSLDDLDVNYSILKKTSRYKRIGKNPHFNMLYCNESETDMIKWNSKYKQKVFEVSASDEFSKKAEIMTKKIAKEFYEWWVGLGNVEFKSEIKRPQDIEDLFQVWFDEHASRGLVVYPKILPCVLQSIANYVGVPQESCPNNLKRQIADDIYAETSPAHVMAFGTCLPQKMKHLPPVNNTAKQWHCVKIPKDLKTMACVWEDVQHLTSTKAFQKWLSQRSHLPMPTCLKSLDAPGSDKKQLFVVPSDYVIKERTSSATTSTQDLALPVSQFSLELKEVLSKLMNQD